MPVTTLDARSALIVVDLQKGIVGLPLAHPGGEIVARAAALADAFRRHDLPVVLVNVAGSAPGRTEQAPAFRDLPPGWADIVPDLRQQPGDHLVTKRTWGAFTGTGLEAHLRGLGVTQVVIAGIATGTGVDSTARQAHELGFNVALAIDAMTDRSVAVHDDCVVRIFPRLGETGTTTAIIDLIERRSA